MPKIIDTDALFDATVRAFGELGYDAATTREIAVRAGVSEVTLFRRFGSKAALLEAALAHALASSPFGSVATSDEVRADLVAILQAYERTQRGYGGAVVTLLSEIPRHPELRGALAALTRNLQRAAQVLASHQARGRLRPGDPMQLLVALLAPLLAAGMWSRAGGSSIAPGFDPQLDPHAVADAFLHGHAPTDGSGAGQGPRG